MTRNLTIKLTLSEAEAAEFTGRWAMILPLTPDGAARLGVDIIATHEALGGLALDMDNVIGQLDVLPGMGGALQGLTAWRNLVEDLSARMDRVRQVIGRGRMVGGDDPEPQAKERLQ